MKENKRLQRYIDARSTRYMFYIKDILNEWIYEDEIPYIAEIE